MTLKGFVICVAERLPGVTKADFEAFIKKNGGTVVKSLTKKCTHAVVADKKSKKALAAKKKGKKLFSVKQVQNRAKAKAPKKKASKKRSASKKRRSVKKRVKKRTTKKKSSKKRTSKKKKKKKSKKKKTTKKRRTSSKKKRTKKKSKGKKRASTKRKVKKKKRTTKKKKKSTKRKARKKTSKKKKTTKRKSTTKKKRPAKRAPKKKATPKKKKTGAKPPKLRRQISAAKAVDVVFSFDTTGSMMSVLRKVRDNVTESVKRLFEENPDIKIGVIAHGDYCDGPNFLRKIDLTDDSDAVINFVNTVPSTGGGDAPEAYEASLNTGNQMQWRDGSSKAFLLIGDEVPHEPDYPYNRDNLDWKKELKGMVEKGIKIYSVQAYDRGFNQKAFYRKCAMDTGGYHIKLEQFDHVTNMILGICFNEQGGAEAAAQFEQELKDKGGYSSGLRKIFDTILKRTGASGELTDEKLHEVSDTKYEVLEVKEDCSIRTFVETNGITFKKGRGFYQFTKPELVQEKKEVVIQDTNTGDFYSGTYARKLIGLKPGERKRVKPADYEDYNIYIQSTSYNRKLKGGTMFLYEKDE